MRKRVEQTIDATGLSDRSDEAAPFADVMEALRHYTRETGTAPLMLGGWEVEHPAIAPPPALLRRLGERPRHLRRYAYASDLHHAREEAAALLGGALTFAGSALTAGHISIQQNSTQALLLALATLKERGARRVVIAAPAYYAVESICRSLGMEYVIVPAANFLTGALDIPRLREAACLPGTVVLVTNPSYSLGVEFTPAEINQLVSALSADTWLLLDETRLGLSWRYEEPWYRNHLPTRMVIVRSPSKIFFIHGLKSSLLLGDPEFLGELERLGEALVGSLPGDAEAVALAYMDSWRAWRDEAACGISGPMRRWHRRVIDSLQRNLALAQEALTPVGFRFSPIDSGPYVLAAAPRERLPRLGYTEAARERGILLMNTRYFLHEHPDWQGFRINLCCDSRHLTEAFARMQTLWREPRQVL